MQKGIFNVICTITASMCSVTVVNITVLSAALVVLGGQRCNVQKQKGLE